MQTVTTERKAIPVVRMPRINSRSAGQAVGDWDSLTLSMGMQTGAVTLKICLHFLPRQNTHLPMTWEISFLDICLAELSAYAQ